MPRAFTLEDDRREAGLSLGQVARYCADHDRPEITTDVLRRLEAGDGDPELGEWLRAELYQPMPDELRQALASNDPEALRRAGARVCRCSHHHDHRED